MKSFFLVFLVPKLQFGNAIALETLFRVYINRKVKQSMGMKRKAKSFRAKQSNAQFSITAILAVILKEPSLALESQPILRLYRVRGKILPE